MGGALSQKTTTGAKKVVKRVMAKFSLSEKSKKILLEICVFSVLVVLIVAHG